MFEIAKFRDLILKGGAVAVLICWVASLQYQASKQGETIEKLQGQMYELQNSTIKDNTKALTEFNLKSR